MTKALYGGSFDPITNGHLNMIERASDLFEEVIVAVSGNPSKEYLFNLNERIELVQKTVAHLPNVIVAEHTEGLLVAFAKDKCVKVLIRGIRNGLDIDLEEMMADMNRHLEPDLDTLFLLAKPTVRFISSSLVKEVSELDGDIRELVPHCVLEALNSKKK